MPRRRIALVGALAVTVLAGCGSERGTSVEPLREAPVVVAGSVAPSPTRHPTELSRPPSELGTTSPTPAADPGSLGWYADSDQRGAEVDGVWVAAWFAPEEDALPERMRRFWMLVPPGGEASPAERLARSVELLDLTPPPGTTSAFGAGLDVNSVTIAGGQVVIDLAGDSPGLRGHATHGLILGESQLLSAATFYVPDAETLCVAYDGVPTDEGGPTFLHDAYGCPLALPFGSP